MKKLDPKTRIAILAGDKIGDSLVSMVFARNLLENGYNPIIFSDPLVALSPLFPNYKIKPSMPEEAREEGLVSFDLRLYPANGDYLFHKDPKIEEELLAIGKKFFYQQKPLADVFAELCYHLFGIENRVRDPGMLPPSGTFRKYLRRVVIHPTSSRADKNWQKAKFLTIAKALQERGYEPTFALAPHEASAWQGCGFDVVNFPTLLEMASFIYESGLFFGNDSGLGHLASAMHLPTVTLCPRKKQGRRWRPAWGPAIVLYPWLHLPGLRMKELFWKHFISPRRALYALDQQLALHCE